jgi:hypothetical protein
MRGDIERIGYLGTSCCTITDSEQACYLTFNVKPGMGIVWGINIPGIQPRNGLLRNKLLSEI